MSEDALIILFGLLLFTIFGPVFYMESERKVFEPTFRHTPPYWLGFILCLAYLAWGTFIIYKQG